MSAPSVRHSSERGAVMVHVALGMIAFMALSALSVDYGVKWVSRVQAQNAADAGALAGATALAFDDSTDRTATGMAQRSARTLALANTVWGGPVDVQFDTDITFPPCPPPDSDDPSTGGPFDCIRVDVFRNQDRSNPLPTFFSKLVGVNDQGVKATATAKLGEGNSLKCMLPFGVADRWADYHDPTPDTEFFANDALGVGAAPDLPAGVSGWTPNDFYREADGDVYISPIQVPEVGQHTGFTFEEDYGRQMILKLGSQGQSQAPDNYSSGWANMVNLTYSNGGHEYREDISGCNEYPISIAAADETCEGYPNSETTEEGALNGCVSVQPGVDQGNTRIGVNAAVGVDPTAYWDPDGGEDGNGIVMNEDGEDMGSQRIRPLIVFDIDHYMSQNCGGNTCMTKVGNILGFFLEGMCNDVISRNQLDPGMVCDDPNKQVVGRIVTLPAQYFAGAGNIADDAAFLKFVILVR